MSDPLGERSAPWLADATWTELGRAATPPILALPIGSCEQHGPHLPLDTDTRIAIELAERLATAVPGVVVAPAIAIGASGEHHGFPGTLSIGLAVTEAVIVELVRSADWSAGVVLVNGHGGNATAVRAAVATLRHEGRRVLEWWPRIAGGDAHAGATETSIMLAIAPALVRLEAIEPGNTSPLAELLPTMSRNGIVAVAPNGVLGDPTGASAEHGATLLDTLAADLVRHVLDWS
ncbi:MAG: Creatininase [Ilumatobacteraceae bacterium]|nr:Creatininase [Ilumatobacteraceae bacterium]